MMYTEDKKVRFKYGTGTLILYYQIQLFILKIHIISAHLTNFSLLCSPICQLFGEN